jgi:hypothetical protein
MTRCHGCLIQAALESNDLEVFQKLVDFDPASVNQKLGMSGDPLHRAVWRNIYWQPEHPATNYRSRSSNGADPNGTFGNAGAGGRPSDRHLTTS